MTAGDRGQRPAQVLRRLRGAARRQLRDRGRARSSACSARTAPARRRPSRSSRATAAATAARFGPRRRPADAPGSTGASASASSSSRSAMYPNLTVRESLELFAGYYERPRDVDEVIELVGLGEKRDARVRTLSGGQKRRLDLGLGARRRPRAPLPRRADDRLRPRRAPRRLGDDPLAARARQDDPADDALPRRGGAARRPRRRPARGPHRRDRPARAS